MNAREPAATLGPSSRATLGPLRALDVARRSLVRVLGKGARPLIVARERRVALFGVLGLLVAFVGALAFPSWTIGIGTVVLGVPHVLSDVRYLVVRRDYTRRLSLYAAVVLSIVGAALGFGLRGALVGALVATAFSGASLARRALVGSGVGLLLAVAWHFGTTADLVYAQAHNLVAIVFFAIFVQARARDTRGSDARGTSGKRAYLPLVVFAALAGFLLTPYGLEALVWAGGLLPSRAPAELDVGTLAGQIAPLADPSWAVRGVVFFAFAQAAHYVVWLRLVPELDRPSPRPRSFTQSARALVRDLTPWGCAFFATGLVVFVVWGLVSLAHARIAYLQSAFFHGYLELAVLAVWACEGIGKRPALVGATEPADTKAFAPTS